ncbi:MAG: glycosyltransferase [Dehalococcoidia bacterium]
MTGADQRVGAVVLTHNRVTELLRTLDRLTALAERPAIVVVDNASRDGTADRVARRFRAVRVVRLPVNVGAAARNLGVRLCLRPYVALYDDDTWWEPGSMTGAADLLDAHPDVAVVSGRVLVGPENRPTPPAPKWRAARCRRGRACPAHPCLASSPALRMVRLRAFLAAGGFEPRLFLEPRSRCRRSTWPTPATRWSTPTM